MPETKLALYTLDQVAEKLTHYKAAKSEYDEFIRLRDKAKSEMEFHQRSADSVRENMERTKRELRQALSSMESL